MAESEAASPEPHDRRRDAPTDDPAQPSALLSLILSTGWYLAVALLYSVAFFTHR